MPRKIASTSTEELSTSTYPKANLSEPHALNRPRRRFQNDSLERKRAESGGGSYEPQPYLFTDDGACAGLVLQGATLAFPKSKKSCSRVNAKDETVGIREEPEALYPMSMSPTASGPFLPHHVACPFRYITVVYASCKYNTQHNTVQWKRNIPSNGHSPYVGVQYAGSVRIRFRVRPARPDCH
jgi:hypothetical protein